VRAAAAVVLILTLWNAPANAQTPAESEPAEPGDGVSFLSRFAFHLSAEHLSHRDDRYVWDANYGGEIDFIDYVIGRATFYANYQAILGEEFHAFDPNQGNYILGGRVSARAPGVEAAFVFHHESRHLSDRPKRPPVDWNMVGGRFVVPVPVPRGMLQLRADLRGVILKSYVDYRWEIDAGIRGRLPLASRLALIGDVATKRMAVDGSRERGTQYGARGEAGIRLEGSGAAIELFLAAERRIDPYPLDFTTERWVSAGFRLVSR
jgi:hypothetical protein